MGNTASNSSLRRLSVNLNNKTEAALNRITENEELTQTEAIQRSLLIADFILDAMRTGKRLEVHDGETSYFLQII